VSDQTIIQQRPPEAPPRRARAFASPVAAAAFAAGVSYAWLEALWRLLFTYYPTFDANWVLWDGRVGDIAAMWLTITGLAGVVGIGSYLLWRRKDHVGRIADWTVILVGSAIAAPMIGEIGNTTGSVSSGAGSTDVVAIIAYCLLGVVVVVGGLVLAQLRR
jgi:LPXTG-motif cell wall-anchored protein